MIGHDAPRMLTMSLADGSPIEFETKNVTVEFDTTKVAALLEHYGGNPFEAIGRDYDTDAALAAGYFAMVRAIFLRDRHHISLLILIRNRKPITMIELKLENVQQKYVLMRQLADEVTKTGADAAMLISEVWQARADQLKLYERPADSPVRTESLTLQFVGKTGEPIDFLAEINREGETVSLGDSQISEATAAFNFAPFYQAWGRTVPQDWIDTSRVIMAKQRSG
jgi:hypothetical protein